MAKLFSAREICALALKKIGVISAQDTAASEGSILTALQHLDLLLGEKTATSRFWSLVPQASTFTYPADAESCDISSLMGTGNALDIFMHAYLDDTDDEITLLTREEFDLYKNSGLFPFRTSRVLYVQTDSGDQSFTAYLRPVPTAAIEIRVTGQKLSPTVSAAAGSTANLAHGMETGLQRWMVFALSCDLGDGPLARLPEDRLDRWRGTAEESWAQFNSYRGGGQRSQRRFTRSWNP